MSDMRKSIHTRMRQREKMKENYEALSEAKKERVVARFRSEETKRKSLEARRSPEFLAYIYWRDKGKNFIGPRNKTGQLREIALAKWRHELERENAPPKKRGRPKKAGGKIKFADWIKQK